MRTPLLRSVATATLALCVIAGSAAAQGKGKGHDKGGKGDDDDRGQRIPVAVGSRDGRDNRDIRDDSDNRKDRDHRDGRNNREGRSNRDIRDNRDVRDRGDDRDNDRRVPPGLAKKGGLPPGQAKKMFRTADGVVALRDVFGRHGYTVVRTQPFGTGQYVYYRQGNGLVQRAVVYPGTDRLTFQNVPQLLLQEVLARLH